MSQSWEFEENKLHKKQKNVDIVKPKTILQKLSIQEIPSVTIKQSVLEIGRYCKCGCGKEIPFDARKDRVFFNGTCRRVYMNSVKGYTDSKNVIRARLRINNPRILTLYPEKGNIIDIKITKDCKQLWETCNKIEQERKK